MVNRLTSTSDLHTNFIKQSSDSIFLTFIFQTTESHRVLFLNNNLGKLKLNASPLKDNTCPDKL